MTNARRSGDGNGRYLPAGQTWAATVSRWVSEMVTWPEKKLRAVVKKSHNTEPVAKRAAARVVLSAMGVFKWHDSDKKAFDLCWKLTGGTNDDDLS